MDQSQIVAEQAQLLLAQIGFDSEVAVKVNYDTDSNLYQVLLETKQPALLIGYHGETISSFQLMLSQHIHHATQEWLNVSVNVNDYREHRETALKGLADSVVSRVLATGQPHSLPPLPANERRIVHLYLSEHPDVSTASEGTGKSRSVIVSPKS